MPINTDKLDLKSSLADQVIPRGETIPNPVISPDLTKRISDQFNNIQQGRSSATPVENPTPAPSIPAPTVPDETAAKSMLHRTPKTPNTDPAPSQDAAATDDPADYTPSEQKFPMSSRARDDFKRLEDARNTYRDRAEKAQKALEELTQKLTPLESELAKVKGALPTDIESVRSAAARAAELEETNKQLLARVETFDFERSPRFQNWWKQETESNIKLARSVISPEHQDAVAKIFLEPASAARSAELAKITENMDEASKMVFSGALASIEKAKVQRSEALAENANSMSKLRQQEAAEREQQAQAQSTRRQQITESALAKARELSAFKPIENDADHNAMIPVRENFIRAAISGQIEEDVAVALPGLAFEALHYRDKVVPQLQSELDKANTLIKQLQSSGVPSGQSPSRSVETSSVKPGAAGKFLEHMKKVMGQA